MDDGFLVMGENSREELYTRFQWLSLAQNIQRSYLLRGAIWLPPAETHEVPDLIIHVRRPRAVR
ncbi:MAG: hypothetical protein IJR63_02950 [Synergistaceae bacterium]|nr:hypothetical protein [Synergistaceae bacterium]